MKKFASLMACCLTVFYVASTAIAQKTAKVFYQLSEKRLKDRDLEGAGLGTHLLEA